MVVDIKLHSAYSFISCILCLYVLEWRLTRLYMWRRDVLVWNFVLQRTLSTKLNQHSILQWKQKQPSFEQNNNEKKNHIKTYSIELASVSQTLCTMNAVLILHTYEHTLTRRMYFYSDRYTIYMLWMCNVNENPYTYKSPYIRHWCLYNVYTGSSLCDAFN